MAEYGYITAEFKTIGPSRKITHIAEVKFLIPGEHFNKNRTILDHIMQQDLSRS